VLLVAIHSGAPPAAFLGSLPLQRLRVLLAAPDEQIELDRLRSMARATDGAPPQVIPPMPAVNGDSRLRPRLVQGEILSDENGRLYEKIGRHIRPLQRLFATDLKLPGLDPSLGYRRLQASGRRASRSRTR